VKYYQRLTMSCVADIVVFATIGDTNITAVELSTDQQETFSLEKNYKVKKVLLGTDKNLQNLLLILVSDELNDCHLVFYNVRKHTILATYSGLELEALPLITLYQEGVFIESSMTAEDDIKMNMWTFLDFQGKKVGSYIYESRLGFLASENKTHLSFGHGCFEQTSFYLDKNWLIFAEKESLKLDILQKFRINSDDKKSLSLEREWMNSYPNNDRYLIGKSPVMLCSPFNKIIVKTSSNRHLLSVLDMSSGDKLYNIPIDMLVNHVVVQDGFVVLINSNNMLLSVILDFNI